MPNTPIIDINLKNVSQYYTFPKNIPLGLEGNKLNIVDNIYVDNISTTR